MAGPHHKGTYLVRARALREAANADPSTRCWRCGGLARPNDPWTAGHVVDGDAASQLLPEHASCNYRAGRLSQINGFKTSRRW